MVREVVYVVVARLIPFIALGAYVVFGRFIYKYYQIIPDRPARRASGRIPGGSRLAQPGGSPRTRAARSRRHFRSWPRWCRAGSR